MNDEINDERTILVLVVWLLCSSKDLRTIDVGTIDALTYNFVRVENPFVADRDSNPNKKPKYIYGKYLFCIK